MDRPMRRVDTSKLLMVIRGRKKVSVLKQGKRFLEWMTRIPETYLQNRGLNKHKGTVKCLYHATSTI